MIDILKEGQKEPYDWDAYAAAFAPKAEELTKRAEAAEQAGSKDEASELFLYVHPLTPILVPSLPTLFVLPPTDPFPQPRLRRPPHLPLPLPAQPPPTHRLAVRHRHRPPRPGPRPVPRRRGLNPLHARHVRRKPHHPSLPPPAVHRVRLVPRPVRPDPHGAGRVPHRAGRVVSGMGRGWRGDPRHGDSGDGGLSC